MKLILSMFIILIFNSNLRSQDKIYVNSGYVRPFINEKGREIKSPFKTKVPVPYTGENNIISCKVVKRYGQYKPKKKNTVLFIIKNDKKQGNWLATNHVDSIIFANGKRKDFAPYHKRIAKAEATMKQYYYLDKNIITLGFGIFGYQINAPLLPDLNVYDYTPVTHLYAGFEKMLLNEKLGISIVPFVGLNRKAYGFTVSPRYYGISNRRLRVGFGPTFMLSHQIITETFTDNWGYKSRKEYETTLTTFGMNLNMQNHITPKIFVSYDIGGAVVLSNSQRKNFVPEKWGEYKKGQYVLRMGLGYRF